MMTSLMPRQPQWQLPRPRIWRSFQSLQLQSGPGQQAGAEAEADQEAEAMIMQARDGTFLALGVAAMAARWKGGAWLCTWL